LSTTTTLLHGYADVIQTHVSQIPVSVLMMVEVDADGLAFVGGQVVRHLGPDLSVGSDLHDLCQRGAVAVPNLCLLPVVGDRVGRRRSVPEGESRLGGSTGNGDRLIKRRISVGFVA
jgi:hypothetical protein